MMNGVSRVQQDLLKKMISKASLVVVGEMVDPWVLMGIAETLEALQALRAVLNQKSS